jgi:SagB-type dehydrogenase family enzyme
MIKLPKPDREGTMPLEAALRYRRSGRDYSKKPLSLSALSQLLWAAQGITRRDGERTAPSAGALYPLELYVAAGDVDGIAAGVYRYRPPGHLLEEHTSGDVRSRLATYAWRQHWVKAAPAIIVITTVVERVTNEYGKSAVRYVYMEVGHAAQNIHLQAVTLELATVVVGALDEPRVKKTLELAADEIPQVIMPVGHPRRKPRRS